jgi:hypothetical protein
MSSYERDFVDLEAMFKEATSRLMAEIVEVEILESCSHACTMKRVRDRRLAQVERKIGNEFEGD